jgi:hypothetical protein
MDLPSILAIDNTTTAIGSEGRLSPEPIVASIGFRNHIRTKTQMDETENGGGAEAADVEHCPHYVLLQRANVKDAWFAIQRDSLAAHAARGCVRCQETLARVLGNNDEQP